MCFPSSSAGIKAQALAYSTLLALSTCAVSCTLQVRVNTQKPCISKGLRWDVMVSSSVAFLSCSLPVHNNLVVLQLGLTTAALRCSTGTFAQLSTLLLASHITTQATGMRMTPFQTSLLPSEHHRDALPSQCLFIKAQNQSTISQHGSIRMC